MFSVQTSGNGSCSHPWAKLKTAVSRKRVWLFSRLQVPEDVPFWDGESQLVLYFFLTTDEVPWFQNLHPLSRVVPVDNGKCSQVGTAWGCEGKALPCSYGFTNAYSWKLLVRQMAWSQIEDPLGVLTFVSFKCLGENDPFKKRCHSFWKWQDHYVQYRRIYALLDRN